MYEVARDELDEWEVRFRQLGELLKALATHLLDEHQGRCKVGQEILAGDWCACFVTIKQGKDCK